MYAGGRTGRISRRAPAVPVVPPSAPTITSVTPGNASAVVAFNPPASNGGSPVVEYEVVEEVV